MRTEIIYEDKDVLVIYKPAGLATQSARVGQADVVSELKNYLVKQSARQAAQTHNAKSGDARKAGAQRAGAKKPEAPYLGIIHRLDQPVEGLLVFGKNKKASANLTAQLQAAEDLLSKNYYAVVCGKPATDEARLVDEMYRDENGRAAIADRVHRDEIGRAATVDVVHRKESDGVKVAARASVQDVKTAILQYRREKSLEVAGKEISLLDIFIETGRFHQIRAQMAHAGLPLLGDAKYGNAESAALSGALGVRNVALCAYSLEFKHPATNEKKQFCILPRADIFSKFVHK